MNDRCLAAEHCVALTPDGAAVTTQLLCHGCCAMIQSRYDQLPEILRVLNLFKGGLWGESGEAKVSKGKGEAPIPLNVHALDVQQGIAAILHDVGVLRISDLIRQQNGVSRALHISRLWKQADGIIGLSKPWIRRFAACGQCEQRTLGSYSGEDTVRCLTCGNSLSLDEYSAYIVKVK